MSTQNIWTETTEVFFTPEFSDEDEIASQADHDAEYLCDVSQTIYYNSVTDPDNYLLKTGSPVIADPLDTPHDDI